MNNNVHSALEGTKTYENLTDAFAGEAKSAAKYRIYADMARRGGDPVLAKMLEEVADNETEHAGLWMQYLGENRTDARNLESLMAAEEYESEVMYPEYSAKALEEGFSEIADKMRYAANAEAGHYRMLSEYFEKLRNGTLYEGDEDSRWLCTNCGYIHTGSSAPERCVLCGHARQYFVNTDD